MEGINLAAAWLSGLRWSLAVSPHPCWSRGNVARFRLLIFANRAIDEAEGDDLEKESLMLLQTKTPNLPDDLGRC